MRGPVRLSLIALAALSLGGCEGGRDAEIATPLVYGGEPRAGSALIREYGCGTCHSIPGVREARGVVGPPLTQFAYRAYIAGNLTNTPENLIIWIVDPQAVEPGTAMPTLGVTESEARHIASYLYTLK